MQTLNNDACLLFGILYAISIGRNLNQRDMMRVGNAKSLNVDWLEPEERHYQGNAGECRWVPLLGQAMGCSL